MTTENQIEINGIVSVPEGIDYEKFTDEFLAWIESKGYTFGGGIGPVDENDLPH